MNAFVWFAQKSNTIYCASLNAEKNYWASIKLRCTILWTCTIPLFLLFSACNVMYSAAVAIRDNNFVQHINLHAFILLPLLYCCWKRLHVYVCLVDLYLPLIELSNKFIIMCAHCTVCSVSQLLRPMCARLRFTRCTPTEWIWTMILSTTKILRAHKHMHIHAWFL